MRKKASAGRVASVPSFLHCQVRPRPLRDRACRAHSGRRTIRYDGGNDHAGQEGSRRPWRARTRIRQRILSPPSHQPRSSAARSSTALARRRRRRKTRAGADEVEALRRQVVALAADQQPGRPGRRSLPRAEQRADADPQLRQARPAQSRPGLPRAGPDPDPRGRPAGRGDHRRDARPVAAGPRPESSRADRPQPPGGGSRPPGQQGPGAEQGPARGPAHGPAVRAGEPGPDPAGPDQPPDQRPPGDARRRTSRLKLAADPAGRSPS